MKTKKVAKSLRKITKAAGNSETAVVEVATMSEALKKIEVLQRKNSILKGKNAQLKKRVKELEERVEATQTH